jgi:hypothetical protein
VMWVMWNLVSVRSKIVLVSVQDRCTVCAERTIGLGWMHPMVLLGDAAQVEARFSPLGDSANLEARSVNSLRRTYHRLRNHFIHT